MRETPLEMSAAPTRGFVLSCLLLLAGFVPLTAAAASEVLASPPTDVSVTVYRAPYGAPEALDLNSLGGFALVSETRTVSLPAGESRIRFEGVADGIQSASALITGLPDGVLEKNRDAHVLSPAALVAATVGHNVWLVRTNPKTGKSTSVPGTILSDADDGVVFQGSEGIEALRCSGLPETFHFDPVTDVTATPTLSALVRSPQPFTARIKLSYLAHGFDWMANYSATIAPDGKTMDLGAWVTLANGNGESFPEAHTQVVAGRVNQSGDVEPIEEGSEILAKCWPRGSTSDTPQEPALNAAVPYSWVIVTGSRRMVVLNAPVAAAPAADLQETVVTAQQEQLGDLKLYRVPYRTSVTSRQIKQVRMLDAQGIPIELLYVTPVNVNIPSASAPLRKLLRTRNNSAHRLGVPLPSGRVDAFYLRDNARLLVNETPVRDLAIDEDVEFDLGEAPEVQMTSVIESTDVDPTTVKKLPLVPGLAKLRSVEVKDVNRIEIHNAHAIPVSVELWLSLDPGEQLVRADHTPVTRHGHPAFALTVPANDSAIVRYQTTDTSTSLEPENP